MGFQEVLRRPGATSRVSEGSQVGVLLENREASSDNTVQSWDDPGLNISTQCVLKEVDSKQPSDSN